MPTVIQNNDDGSVDLFDTIYDDIIIKFTGAATLLAGTILAKDTADTTYIPYDPGGAGDELIPSAIIRDEVVVTGAGNINQRGIVSGQVVLERVVVDGAGVPDTNDVAALRQTGIIAIPVRQLAFLDNQ